MAGNRNQNNRKRRNKDMGKIIFSGILLKWKSLVQKLQAVYRNVRFMKTFLQ